MSNYTQLQQFKPEQLLLDEEDTRIVLKFIFESVDHEFIDSLTIDDKTRAFAQGLLVEAIDASYSVGFVEALFRSTANPGGGVKRVLKGFGRRAAAQWFKNANVHDLQDVKVYDFVRHELARRFRTSLRMLIARLDKERQPGAFLVYHFPQTGIPTAWG